MKDGEIMWHTAEALDSLSGQEAAATHMRFLAGYSYERIAAETGLTPDRCQQLAIGGLKQVRAIVFDQK